MIKQEGVQNFTNIGTVLSVGDGILVLNGLDNVESGALVEIITDYGREMGLALNLENQTVSVVVLGDDFHIMPGDSVRQYAASVSIPVGKQLLGRVIDSLGNPQDGGENIQSLERFAVDVKAPGIITRKSVHQPLQTGIKAVDSMIPIGRGQRELVIGDRQTGKTTFGINTFLMQAVDNASAEVESEKIFCIFVAIGQKKASIVHLISLFRNFEALAYITIMSAAASASAALQYLAPYAACRIGEWYRDNGLHSVIIYDDLSKHAVAYRQLSLLLRRPPGREAYPGDVFYLHSRLLERAAKLNEKYGSGSLTALPVIETQKGDVSAYIPTNVISITDGQIFLETELFYNGIRPAVNAGLSVSRVGSSAQNILLRKITSSLRFELAQYRTVAVLEELSSDLDPTTKHQIHRGSRLVEILKQSPYRPMLIEQQILLLYAAMNGYFDSLPVSKLLVFEQELIYSYKSFDLVILHLLGESEEQLTFDYITYYFDITLTNLIGEFQIRINR